MSENTPVVEVVLGVLFERLRNLRAPHLGLFWEKFKERFPICEHQTRLGGIVFDNFQLALPRIWFLTQDKSNIIQVQDDRFYFNWRRTSPSEGYPGYEEVKRELEEKFAQFNKFVSSRGLGPLKIEAAELAYINQFRGDQKDWRAIDTFGDIFPEVRLPAEALSQTGVLRHFRWECRLELPEECGTLTAKAHDAVRSSDENEIIVLELRSQGLGADRSAQGLSNWFDGAHSVIRNTFESLVNPALRGQSRERT